MALRWDWLRELLPLLTGSWVTGQWVSQSWTTCTSPYILCCTVTVTGCSSYRLDCLQDRLRRDAPPGVLVTIRSMCSSSRTRLIMASGNDQLIDSSLLRTEQTQETTLGCLQLLSEWQDIFHESMQQAYAIQQESVYDHMLKLKLPLAWI